MGGYASMGEEIGAWARWLPVSACKGLVGREVGRRRVVSGCESCIMVSVGRRSRPPTRTLHIA